MIITTQPDKQKAKSLRDMAVITLERLKETDKEKYPSHTLIDCYDIIRRLMEALNYLDGIKIKGEGAHIKVIDFVCDGYELGVGHQRFIQEMRNYRNRISYEGFNVNRSYIGTNFKKIESIIGLLLELVDKKLSKEN